MNGRKSDESTKKGRIFRDDGGEQRTAEKNHTVCLFLSHPLSFLCVKSSVNELRISYFTQFFAPLSTAWTINQNKDTAKKVQRKGR